MKSKKKRFLNIEILRVFSACCVVYFHVDSPLSEIRKYAYSGLIIFLLISTMLAFMGQRNKQPFLRFFLAKFERILIPFVGWSLLYLLVSIYTVGPSALKEKISFLLPFSGTFYHLWYLPFIFLVLLLSYLFKKHLKNYSYRRMGKVCLMIGMLFMIVQVWVTNNYTLGTLSIQWLSSIPSVFLGVFVALQFREHKEVNNFISPLFPVTVVILSIILLIFSETYSSQMYAAAYGIGALLFYLSFFLHRVPDKLAALLEYLSGLTLGVYLVHPLILLIVIKYSPFSSIPIKFFLTLILSFTTISLLMKNSFLRKFI